MKDLLSSHAARFPAWETSAYAPALVAIENALTAEGPVLVTVDGRCASGKTRFAQRLAQLLPCAVFHMDDFFLPPEMRTRDRLSQPGGNVHYERAAAELFEPLSRGETVTYDRFNCRTGTMESREATAFHRLSIVEGSYSHHPALAKYPALRIFFTADPTVQLRRLQERNPETLKTFQTRWIPLEERYFTVLDVPGKADVVIDTSEL